MVTKAKKAAPKKSAAKSRAKAPAVKSPLRRPADEAGKRAVKKTEVAKLRIRVRAYEHKILDASVRQIMDTAARFDAEVQGPVPLPTEIRKYTVNRGAFVHKNAREQFEMRAHKRLVDIVNPSPKLVEALTNLSLPSGVNIEVKML
ncbi:MAG: small subunit ribosomal protein S10 [Parcubacteria group bacterium Gr01-1014_17]|nr:MAG: small subunit ribosomal protein S10 [Parcubacteria group bacterium Gr01-1014_17]